MRSIKFRAKSLDGIWFKWKLLDPINMAELAIDPDTLGEWTGLLDKNGKEIYEGDIIQSVYPNNLEPLMKERGQRYEIYFTLGAFKASDLLIGKDHPKDSFLHDKSFGREHLEGYEVIGNIYENPDLLTK